VRHGTLGRDTNALPEVHAGRVISAGVPRLCPDCAYVDFSQNIAAAQRSRLEPAFDFRLREFFICSQSASGTSALGTVCRTRDLSKPAQTPAHGVQHSELRSGLASISQSATSSGAYDVRSTYVAEHRFSGCIAMSYYWRRIDLTLVQITS
jgi:hypothetical protein